ncbi:Lin1244/Lin1753 domain-containing protein [Dysgonomonas sp. 521]|uniref:Lin1244/Lin1753 domain-containing protein n=1 Tax=Dysgonomonas sp. 521 TaxID=2302932 RepID=UPI001C87A011|nr:Lin1244/Lin1753 domain-containing protein [Dysgonomonas sp. 521]
MAKKSFYFPHDGNARNDDKIIAVRMRHKMEGYGVYFAILERLLESSNYMCTKDYNLIAFDLHVSSELVKSIVENFDLFKFKSTDDGDFFYSESFNDRMIPLENIREQRSLAGKKSAEKRAKKNSRSTTVQRPLSKIPTEYSKVDNTKKESPNGDKKETGVSSPALSDFEKFDDWIKKAAPYCANPKNFPSQITEVEFLKLKECYSSRQIADIVEQIENRKDLRKRYVNLYRTVLNWAKKEYGKPKSQQEETGKITYD